MSDDTIPDAAVEAAAMAMIADKGYHPDADGILSHHRHVARLALTAAIPYLVDRANAQISELELEYVRLKTAEGCTRSCTYSRSEPPCLCLIELQSDVSRAMRRS